MDNLYRGIIKLRVKRATAEVDIPLRRAIDFLKENPKSGIIVDSDGVEYTLEELEHVKNFGYKPGTESNIPVTSVGQVPEDTYRQIFGTLGDKTKSSPECDN